MRIDFAAAAVGHRSHPRLPFLEGPWKGPPRWSGVHRILQLTGEPEDRAGWCRMTHRNLWVEGQRSHNVGFRFPYPFHHSVEEDTDQGAIDTPKESEAEDSQGAKKEEPKETMTVENGRRRGRRRVMKKKTVKDDEGYLGESLLIAVPLTT